MKEDIKDKWVAALRSGDYKQGMNALYKENGSYCCLGVLCAVLGHKPVKATSGEFYEILGETSVLPFEVVEEAGLRDNDGSANEKVSSGFTSLIDVNDTSKSAERADDVSANDFNTIADIIEANWKEM